MIEAMVLIIGTAAIIIPAMAIVSASTLWRLEAKVAEQRDMIAELTKENFRLRDGGDCW